MQMGADRVFSDTCVKRLSHAGPPRGGHFAQVTAVAVTCRACGGHLQGCGCVVVNVNANVHVNVNVNAHAHVNVRVRVNASVRVHVSVNDYDNDSDNG